MIRTFATRALVGAVLLLFAAPAALAGALHVRALPGIPATDGVVTYAYPDSGARPSVSIAFTAVQGAADYAVLCELAQNDKGKEWGNVAVQPDVRISDVPYGRDLSCVLGARNPEGVSVSDHEWIIPVLVDLPVPTKVTLQNDISSGGRFRVAWTERRAIPRWVPRTTYVTLMPANSMRQVARATVKNRLARATYLQVPSGLEAGRYRVCVTVENDYQGTGGIPKASCAIRVISPSYSGGGGSSGGGGDSSGGSSGETGQTASIGPVRV